MLKAKEREVKPIASLIEGDKERIKKAKGQLLRASQVASLLGLSVSSVWRIAKDNAEFPKPFKVSARVTVWDEAEVMRFIQKARKMEV